MKIVMIGTGYVGLVSGTCFAEVGNDVVCVDIDKSKVEKLGRGVIPIYEPGLEAMVLRNVEMGRLKFVSDLAEALPGAQAAFIAVGTPPGEDGSADLQYVLAAAGGIGDLMSDYLVVVDKSTVPVGTAEKVRARILERLALRGANLEFDVVSNPEFLKEGAAVADFMRPDRVVVGADSERARKVVHELYRPFQLSRDKMIYMDVRSAEMTKYAANCMLATKISFINEIARICEAVGADVRQVRVGIGSDSRIGYSFIYPGPGYGGSCFPKDVQALIRTARAAGVDTVVLEAVEGRNALQKRVVGDKALKHFGGDMAGRTIGLWGLSFKPETDDMRESPAIVFVEQMLAAGARIQAYDPKAMDEARHYFGDEARLVYCHDPYDACKGADALVLMTEWLMFRSPDFERIARLMRGRALFDGRNQWSPEDLRARGFDYYGIGTV